MKLAAKINEQQNQKAVGQDKYERRKTIVAGPGGIIPGAMGNANAFISLLKKGSAPVRDQTEQILIDHGLLPKDELDEMENVQLTNDYYNKIKFVEFVTFFFAWIGLGAGVVEYELRYDLVKINELTYQREVQLQIILAINTLCSLCAVTSIVSRYMLILNWQIQKKQLLPLDTLVTTKYYQTMILESFVIILAPYPGLQSAFIIEVYPDRGVEVPLNINVLLLCIALIGRLYLVIRFALAVSKYRCSRQQRLCMINGTEASFMFAMKAFKKDQPYLFISIALIVPLVVCGYGMRLFERPLIPTSGANFDSIANCIWCCISTMTTVGYGDLYPISNLGRTVGILACLWGVFIVSIFVVTLNNLLEFNKGEEKSYEILVKLKAKEEIRTQAIAVILSAQKQKVERQKDDLDPNQLAVVFRDFRKNVFSLKQISKRVRQMYEDYNDVEMITKDIEEINQEMDILRVGQNELLMDFQDVKKIIDKRLGHENVDDSLASSLMDNVESKQQSQREGQQW